MANEATVNGGYSRYKHAFVADATAIPLGTVCVMNTANVITAHTTHTEYFAGIAARSKAANDGQTALTIALDGDWNMTADGSITAGQLVVLGTAANKVRAIGAASIEKLGQVLGRALNTVTDGQTVVVRVRGD